MIDCALAAAPKLRPPAGTPPIAPASTVSVIRSRIPLLQGHRADALGNSDSEVHHRVDLQQHRSAAGDRLTNVQRRRLPRVHRRPYLAHVGRVVALRERLHASRAVGGDDDAVSQRCLESGPRAMRAYGGRPSARPARSRCRPSSSPARSRESLASQLRAPSSRCRAHQRSCRTKATSMGRHG
jgi:hypothetical protein